MLQTKNMEQSRDRQPYLVCEECGLKAHKLTFGDRFINPKTGEVTRMRGEAIWKEDTCQACGENKYVAERREFFFAKFDKENFPKMQDNNSYNSNHEVHNRGINKRGWRPDRQKYSTRSENYSRDRKGSKGQRPKASRYKRPRSNEEFGQY